MNPESPPEHTVALCLMPTLEPTRLDQLLARLLPDFSRSQIQQWIKNGHVLVSGQVLRPRDKLAGGETISIEIPAVEQVRWAAQSLPLDIVFEDDHVLVLNKPAGLVVHPGAGNPDHTLLNALLSHAPGLCALPRAGIVHRLDKDTSGLMVIAKSERARTHLIKQLSSRELQREYTALVSGVMISGGVVDAPIGRHPRDRKRMAVNERGKTAISQYRVRERFRAHTLVGVTLRTGRTHQIRVHMAHVHFPIVGDPVYGGRMRIPPGISEAAAGALRGFRRQALHACKLGLVHPLTRRVVTWEREMPDDMRQLVETLRQDNEHDSSR